MSIETVISSVKIVLFIYSTGIEVCLTNKTYYCKKEVPSLLLHSTRFLDLALQISVVILVPYERFSD